MYTEGHITKENPCSWGGERGLGEMLGEGRVPGHAGGRGPSGPSMGFAFF